MKSKNYSDILNNEIESRIENDFWDRKIAVDVLASRNKKKKGIIIGSSLSSLAAAAVIVMVFFFGIRDELRKNPYEKFITTQVQGTYQEVYKTGADKTGNTGSSVLGDYGIDSLIDDALAVR